MNFSVRRLITEMKWICYVDKYMSGITLEKDVEIRWVMSIDCWTQKHGIWFTGENQVSCLLQLIWDSKRYLLSIMVVYATQKTRGVLKKFKKTLLYLCREQKKKSCNTLFAKTGQFHFHHVSGMELGVP